MKKLVTIACLMGASLAGFAGGNSSEDRQGFYGYGSYNQLMVDSELGLDDESGFGLGFGYYLNKNWSLEVPYNTFELSSSSALVDVDMFSIDAMYSATSWGNFNTHPFFKLGYVSADIDSSALGFTADDSFIKAGFGLQHFFNDTFFGRIGYDQLFGGEDHGMAYAAFGAFLGKTTRYKSPAPVVAPAAPKDSDNDGVIDANDRCPATPAGAKVDYNGCPVDTDGDGVFDYQDACANTPAGAKVDEKGCRIKLSEKVVIDMRLNFDTNKNAIKPEMVAEIAKVAEFLRQYPDVNAEIQGHTDSMGAASYNQSLSQKRADAVAAYLVSDFGVDASRMTAVGHGEANPIADNSTAEGRAMNRRAEAHLETVVEK